MRPVMSHRSRHIAVAGAVALVGAASQLNAQVTTSSLAGRVLNAAGQPVPAAQVVAVHEPSGTTYRATTRPDGRYSIPGMRVGGPYRVSVRALGYAPVDRRGLALQLGNQAELDVALQQAAVQLEAVAVTAETNGTISSARTGAATRVSSEALQTLPTISRNISDFTRLTPQASGTSFAGMDNRLNNIMIDGAFFNNAFGLGSGQPGGRTGVSPVPLDAIDQVQVSIAPYDVRQSMFVGAAVNAVTRSGTNNWEGSAYYLTRDQSFNGRESRGVPVPSGTFQFGQFGARLGGPILKNRLFFFANLERDELTEPGTTFTPNPGGARAEGNMTRVLESDLRRVQTLLQRFDYDPGSFQGFDLGTPSDRFLTRLDFNANDQNKFSLRYTQLNSSADVLVSNSSSLGFGNRRTSINALSFSNSNYQQLENNRSIVGEWNSNFRGGRMSNQLIVGYTTNDESRGQPGTLFPTVDILEGGITYMSFGTEPFTPNNELRYDTFQLQNNFQWFLDKHELTFGATVERYNSENVFFPGSQSVYSYNSLQDFIADAEGHLANPNRTTSPVSLRRFQVRFNNIPGQEKPTQPLEVTTWGGYLQDQWRPTTNFTLTTGLRLDLPVFGQTGFANPQANALTFRGAAGEALRFRTEQLPETRVLLSPRIGFNWDVRRNRQTQLRGGTGVFTGRPLYVWISNQIGQNGIITGLEELDNTTARPFNPNPDRYKPTNVTGAPAATYEVNYTDPNFRFPQQWRSNFAIDQRLPYGFVATGEVIYGRDLNGISYINANLSAPDGRFAGPDQRDRWSVDDCPTVPGTQQRVNCNITAAYVLGNQNEGYNYTLSASLEKAFAAGFFFKAAYNFSQARNLNDPGSIAAGSWTGNQTIDPNNPRVAFSSYSPGHRSFLVTSYRREYFRLGATTVSLFAERFTPGNVSYTYGGDFNGDGGVNNDLLYIPRDRSEIAFQQFTASGATFTAQQQADVWEQYVAQDPYLRERRGQYAERGGFFLPQVLRADFAIIQDVFRPIAGKRNTVQLRLDVFNFTNLLNQRWGAGYRLQTAQPLVPAGVNAQGVPQFRLRNFGNRLMDPTTFQRTAGLGDIYRMQLGLRYTFQ